MSGREWLSTIGELGESVWENAALPENYWNKDQNYNQSNIHVPPLFAGVSDGVVEEISDYPQLIKLGYDIASKKEIREELWNSVKNIDADKVINFAKDEIKNKWKNYNFTDKPYLGKHELGKDGVAIVKFATGAGALVKGIKETGEKFAKQVDNVIESIIQKQKKLINDVKTGKIDLSKGNSNFRKGNFGEMCTDIDLTEKGYKALHNNRIQDIDAPIKKGIDGVFEKNGEYYIVESKYRGTAKLKDTKDGPQMSDNWINGSNRLKNAVDEKTLKVIEDNGYKRILSEVSPDGKIIYKELDKNGKILNIINL